MHTACREGNLRLEKRACRSDGGDDTDALMAKHHVAVLEMDIRVAQPRMRYFDDDIIRPQLAARRVFVDTPALGALENGIVDGHGDDRDPGYWQR